MSTKSRSVVSETPNAKLSLATPRVSRSVRGVVKSDADSSSQLQTSRRLSGDRVPRPVASKTAVVSSPKLTAPTEKKAIPIPTRSSISKSSELQAEINQAQEDLKKAKAKLGLVEKEKEKALDELKEAQRLSGEANEKLREALVAQKRAEEDSEIEKFRAIEIEQAGIEASQKKEDEWKKEIEVVRSQHAVDVAALQSATEEIQKAKEEIVMVCDAKDQALLHAGDVTKLAEAHVDKIKSLSAEVAHLKSVLDSRVESEANENDKFVLELKLEIESLKQELEKVKTLEEKLMEKEALLEQLNVDLEAARMAESYARNLVDELHERVEELASQTEQARRLERSASESLESVMKQLERSNDSLQDAESEITTLKEKFGLLEISFRSEKKDFEEAERRLQQAENEASEMEKKVEFLEAELETVKEEKTQSLNNEKLAAASVLDLLDEKNKVINELGISRNEEEKSKKALESLASALHEVSSEARDTKEKLSSVQVEHENYKTQTEDLKLVLKATNEKYESMLDEAKQEIDALTSLIQESRCDHENSKSEWDQKEIHLMNSVKKSEEEKSSMENEINRLVNLLEKTQEEASATRDEGSSWKNSYKEAESEIIYLKELLGEAKVESMNLKEDLMDRENELQNIIHENDELRKKEISSQKRMEELSNSLQEALVAKEEEENHSDSEKEYDMLPKVVEFSEQNGTTGDLKKPKVEEVKHEEKSAEAACISNGEVNEDKGENKNDNSDSAEVVNLKMWESCKIEEKDFAPELEQESLEDEVESKSDGVESFDQVNGGSSPSKEQQSQKKKKLLFSKFGSLLKKKSNTTSQK